MQVSDVLRRVQWAAGDSTGQLIDATNVCDLINDAQIQINQEAKVVQNYADLGNVVVNGNEVVVTGNLGLQSIMRVYLEGGTPEVKKFRLEPIQYEEVIGRDSRYGTDTQTTGTPQYYFVGNRTHGVNDFVSIFLYPASNAVYTLSALFVKEPTKVAGVNDYLQLPSIFHPLVSRLCLAAVKEKDEDYEASAMIRASVFSELATLISSVHNPQEETYNRVRGIDGPDYFSNALGLP